jgi:chemotaxis protein MotB
MAASRARRHRVLRGHPYEGAWKVAYADFATAMMAVFVVLWLLTQADLRLRQQIARYFRDPTLSEAALLAEEARAHGRAPDRPRLLPLGPSLGEQELLEGEKKAIEQTVQRIARTDATLASLKDQVIAEVTDAGLAIQIVDKGADRLFEPASARLAPGVEQLLALVSQRLGRLPEQVQVAAHTDGRPIAPEAAVSGWEITFARADAARRVLEASGLWPGQVHRVVGYGDTEPLVPTNPLADENRRLSILLERSEARPGARDCAAPSPVVLPPDPLPGR